MKKILIALTLFAACKQSPIDKSKQAAKEIIEADLAMNEMAATKGFHTALLLYAVDSVIKPNENELPIIGKNELQKHWLNKPDTKSIAWKPTKAEASISGDMGYTFGNWQYTAKDTVLYGNYYTIWKKQADGTWKFIIDGGNNTPKPL
jgi:ketosteroid isomerase-like protein